MSAVFSVAGISPAEVATLSLVAGLGVVDAVRGIGAGVSPPSPSLKWPNDVYVSSRKLGGILCERHGDNVVVGIGINVLQREFPDELRDKATSLSLLGIEVEVDEVLDRVLTSLSAVYDSWRRGGFAALYSEFAEIDFLKGREVTVIRTDDDTSPIRGICGGITADGSLLVGDERIYAGEVRW